MKKKIFIIIILFFIVLLNMVVISNAGAATNEPEQIIYPVPSLKKNGLITYTIEYDCEKTKLRFSQNKTWDMKKRDIKSGVMSIDIEVPYTAVTENFSIPTEINHQLKVYPVDDILNKAIYEADFKVPTMRYTGFENRTISIDVGEQTVLKPVTSKLQLKSNPDNEEAFTYIWDNMKIQTSDSNVVEIVNIDSSEITRKIDITLKGISAGKAEINLVSPTNQIVKLATVTVKGTIQEEEKTEINSTKTIVYPNISKKQDGYIEYIVNHPQYTLSQLNITQNKDYKMTKSTMGTYKTKVKVIIPYTEIKTDSNTPTIISHELYVSAKTGTSSMESTFSTEFKVPMKIYEIKEEKYFCGLKISSKKETIKRETVKEYMEENKEFTIKNKYGQTIQETETISTGMKIQIDDKEYEIAVTGDTNGDGKITITDVAKVQLHFVKLEQLTGSYLKAADMNENSDITITDLARIQLAYLGLIDV